ncbi:MAG: AAA family ATPase, partial [Tumebacillaceae bacterium]
LKSNMFFYSLIIEEPEAHLNLDMQRKMAQAIVRLVNLGLPVWITTHSDTMFQQINNLIKLNNHPKRTELAKKFGYEESDFLDPICARVYQFRVNEGKTKVEASKLTQYGFAAPTFNETIMDLTKETIELQEDDSDDDE